MFFHETYKRKVEHVCIKHQKICTKVRKLSSKMVFSKYVLGGNYMIPVCRDDISTSPARIDFTVRLHEEVKLHLDKIGRFST